MDDIKKRMRESMNAYWRLLNKARACKNYEMIQLFTDTILNRLHAYNEIGLIGIKAYSESLDIICGIK